MPSNKKNRTVSSKVRQDLGDPGERAVVLLPYADVVAEQKHLPQTGLLERRANVGELAPGRQDRGRHPLASSPVDIGEVLKRRASLEIDCIEVVLDHQPSRLLDPRLALFDRDRLDSLEHGAQTAELV
jgi:hypothetical protein